MKRIARIAMLFASLMIGALSGTASTAAGPSQSTPSASCHYQVQPCGEYYEICDPAPESEFCIPCTCSG